MNIIGRRKIWYLISLILIIPGIVALILWGLPTGIDFRGGTLLDIQFYNQTAKDQVQEAINAAGVWQLPVVFVVTNNQWAISVPRETQTGAETLAQKAVAAGFEGVQIDGNDVVAVHHAMREALAKARSGGGPTLIEAVTYRLSDHTTADDASRYRPPEELAEAWKLEPVLRLRNYLSEMGAWNRAQEEALLQQCNEEVQAAAQAYLDTPPPAVEQMFDHLYAVLPAHYAAQRASTLAAAAESAQ